MRGSRLDLVLFALVFATPVRAAGLEISGGWFRAMPAHLPAAGYFTLHNATPRTVSLTGAKAPGCAMLMLHKSTMVGGMSSMSEVTHIDVAPGAGVSFAPGGYHLMCMGPSLVVGTDEPVTLTFSDGGMASAKFAVRNASGAQ